MTGYTVQIKESSRELTARERIMMKDTSDAVKIDTATENDGAIIIKPTTYAVLSVHNEKSDNKDYLVYIIIDENGTKYVTGSESFWSSFQNITEEMEEETDTYSIKAYRLPSKNYTGKEFLTCSII